MLLLCHEHLIVLDLLSADVPYCAPNSQVFVEEGLFSFGVQDEETIKNTWYIHLPLLMTHRMRYLQNAERDISPSKPFSEIAAIALLPYSIFASLEKLSLITMVLLKIFGAVHIAPIPIPIICGTGAMSGIAIDLEATFIDFVPLVDGTLVPYASHCHPKGTDNAMAKLCKIISENASEILLYSSNGEDVHAPYSAPLSSEDIQIMVKKFLYGSSRFDINGKNAALSTRLLVLLHDALAAHLAPIFEYGISFALKHVDPLRRSILAESIAMVGGPSMLAKNQSSSFQNVILGSIRQLENCSEYQSSTQIATLGLAKNSRLLSRLSGPARIASMAWRFDVFQSMSMQ